MDTENSKIEDKNKIFKNPKFISYIIIFCLFISIIIFFPFKKENVIFHISSGQSVNSIASELNDKDIINNNFLFKLFIKLINNGKGIALGDYLINKNSPVWSIAWQLGNGNHNIKPIKITIIEGLTNEEIADIFKSKIPSFNKDLFLSSVKDKQGYLFPDTYFFFPLDTNEEIIKKMNDNFNKRIKNLENRISLSGKSLKEIITMASILEGEAKGKEDVKIISGILWKRISLGMPLQVDVDKWTYQNEGLPNTPLNNPGLMSIEASINPEESSYLYYIHGKDGQVHYANSFESHKVNINNYLK